MCNSEINKDNETEEHIFLNSIGGNLKPKNLICKVCNSSFGDTIDAALSKQFNFVANMLNIERDRGQPQPFVVVDKNNGEIYSYEPGGKPKILKPSIKLENNHYSIEASDIKQARQILKGLKRKHKEINIEEVLKGSQKNKKYIDNHLSFNICFGGDKESRAICKIAVNFYLYAGGFQGNIKHLVPYLKCEDNCKSIVSPVYFRVEPIKRNSDDILHSIIVKGNKKEKFLIAYIELFNFYKVIVLLNDDYEGDDIEFSYFFDVLSRREVKREYKLEISKDEINNVLNQKELPVKEIESQLNLIMAKIYKKQDSEHINKLLETALNNSLRKHPEGEIITEEMRDELVNETMKQITPWILHNLKNK